MSKERREYLLDMVQFHRRKGNGTVPHPTECSEEFKGPLEVSRLRVQGRAYRTELYPLLGTLTVKSL